MPDTENRTGLAATAIGPPLSTPALGGIRRLSALDTVRARIAMAIDLGLLAPGERLPAAAEIAAALDVGEITVRRALVALCDDGLLERRRGRNGGTLVAQHPAKGSVSAVGSYRSDTDAVQPADRPPAGPGVRHRASRRRPRRRRRAARTGAAGRRHGPGDRLGRVPPP